MGNFLVLIPGKELAPRAEELFGYALQLARTHLGQSPQPILQTDELRVAMFLRRNGSGFSVASDPATGNWLLVIGTWFHAAGYGSGEEARLLARYQQVGAMALALELEGFFVIASGNQRMREVTVMTDLVGSCHCFVRKIQGGLAISGSSLLLAGLADFHLDAVACQEFLGTGIIYEDRTLFSEVRKLQPASVYRFTDDGLHASERYWRVANVAAESLGGMCASQALWEGLMAAASKVGKVFRRPVCDLTGGYDSRALVAVFLSAGVSISTVVSGRSKDPDVIVSQGLAMMEGLPHLHLTPPRECTFEEVRRALPLTDGEYNLVEYSRILRVHETLAKDFDISINGSFGEVARGYWWELLFPHTGARRPLDAQKLAARRYAAKGLDATLFPSKTRLALAAHMAGVVERINQGLSGLPNTLQMDNAYLQMRMQRWQGRIASSTNRIWPCLSPFMFRSVLEIMLATAARFRQRSWLVRRMLADFRPRWANFPLEHGYPAAPVTWKNLHRFAPLANYYGGKILARVAARARLRRGPVNSTGDPLPARLQLWSQEEVKAVLDPHRMLLGSVLDEDSLRKFLVRSQSPAFEFDEQWARLLSLEYTMRVLGQSGPRFQT